ncbi:MAG TPA: amidohydrolase family protein, partial [Blastocatellia bacterium]|nr:amidohydrolase family protein [Blastocatellia bacterium]
FRLAEHGSIEAGKRANIVVFDEERILDRATFEESRQYPEGISYVIVGGRVTVEGDRQSETGSGITVSPEPIA